MRDPMIGDLMDELAAAEDRVTALTATVVAGIRIASQYLDTDRGDLDGWVEAARAALAAPTKENHE